MKEEDKIISCSSCVFHSYEESHEEPICMRCENYSEFIKRKPLFPSLTDYIKSKRFDNDRFR